MLLLYQPGLEYIVAFFACLHAGVVAVLFLLIHPDSISLCLGYKQLWQFLSMRKSYQCSDREISDQASKTVDIEHKEEVENAC